MEEQQNSKAWTPAPALQRPKQKKKKTWNTKGGRRTQKSLQRARVRLLVWAGTRFTKIDSIGKPVEQLDLILKTFSFFSTSELDTFFVSWFLCSMFLFWVQLKDMFIYVCISVSVLGRHTIRVCVWDRTFFMACVCVCVFVKPVSLCVEILYGHLCLYLL